MTFACDVRCRADRLVLGLLLPAAARRGAEIDEVETRWRRTQLMFGAYFVFSALAMIRSWKALAPFSLVANAAIFAGIVIALSYVLPELRVVVGRLLRSDPAMWDVEKLHVYPDGAVLHGVPMLFGAVIYSFELVCAVLPIENTMRAPREVTGVINR
jgi:hypothetical protein